MSKKIKENDDNIKDFEEVVKENKRLRKVIDVLIKLIEDCELDKKGIEYGKEVRITRKN